MNRKLQTNVEQYTRKTRDHRRWQWFVRAVAGVVVFCTTYALILPAITMEQKAYCGLEEHVHDDSCYIQILESEETTEAAHVHTDACLDASGAEICGFHVHSDSCYTKERGDLLCQQAEQEGHAHTEQCYAEEAVMICQREETDGHTHDETCYTSQPVLTCQLDVAEAHTHGEGCFDAEGTLICQQAESDGHAHGETCYTEQPVLTCQLPEAEAHIHGDGCWEYPLICGQTVAEGHTHNDDCYQWSSNLTCDLPLAPAETTPPQPELTCQDPTHDHTARCYGTWELCCGMEEHSHDLRCFSDPDADVETREIWERTFADVELTGVWAEDVLAIAKSQLGYQESTRNYDVWEDGTTHGYTRYGHWYGSPYGDWCAMFASFCIAYAGVNEEAMPLNWGCRTWIADLSQPELDLYRPAADYTPKPGDLIFFDWEDAEGNSDDLSDHVGIVTELIPQTEETPARIKTIEGNSSNQVKYNTYDQADTQILGYGVIPENPANLEPTETELPQETGPAFTYSDEELYVEVRLPADTTVPAEAVLWVTPIDTENADYAAYLARSEEAVEGTVAGIALYDISFYTPDGKYLPVSDRAEVIMGFTKSPVEGEGELQVLHFAQEDTPPQVIDQVTVGEQELEMRLGTNVQDQPALATLEQTEEPTEETQPATETEPVPGTEPAEETITEVRTVLQFQTDGFSTFAVVQVQTPYVTTILDNNAMLGDLNGGVFAISTRNLLTYNGEQAYRGLTSTPTGGNHLATKTVTKDGNSITVSKKMLWKFEAVAGANNTYYVRPYDPVTKTASGYLQLYVNNKPESITVVPGDQPQAAYQIQVVQEDDEIRLKRADQGRYLSYDVNNGYFTDYGNPTTQDTKIARGALVLSRYGEPAGDKQLPVTNLAGQKLAIVSVRNIEEKNRRDIVLSTTVQKDGRTRLNSTDVPIESFTNGINGLISITKEVDDNTWFWTFEDADAANGVYYIKDSNGKYMTIGNGTASTGDEKVRIIVSSYSDQNGNVYITLNQDGYYLNRFGGAGDDYKAYAGWKDNENRAPGDAGSRFVLARREQFTAEVISRAELWAAGRWTGNKLIFFVRQTDELGNTRYYAMKVDGSAEEIFLEPGQTLANGATIYADVATQDSFLWDANGSPTNSWNANNNLNAAIDLWPRIGELVLSPNGDGGRGNTNAADNTYTNDSHGKASLTSYVETDDNWGWYIDKDDKHENRKGSPLRGEHNAAFYKIADNSQADIDRDIASTIISNLDYFEQSWKSGYIAFENGGFVAKHSDNNSYDTQKGVPATDSTAFYVAALNVPEEEIVETSESHDTVVAKILTRHEYEDAVQIDGNARIILLTKQGDDYYALDYEGNAVKLDTLADDGIAVVLEGKADYNTNRILWDAMPGEANPANGQFIDMPMENEAVEGLYLSPWQDTLQSHLVSQYRPNLVKHAPGFYGLSETGSLIITSEDGTTGTVIKYENGKYVVEAVDNLDGHNDPAYTFYVALVTDRDVQYNAENKTVAEYAPIPAVNENVKMRLFNYGSAIDYYGQTYNQTTYDDGKNENGNKDKDNLIYRFFHRPSFKGQAIDGTNEKNAEYAEGDAFQDDPNGTKRKLEFGPTLDENGAPYLILDNSNTIATTPNDNKFNLGYLFGGNQNSSTNLTLYQTNGGDWKKIENATGTNINPDGSATLATDGADPVLNPNYAVQSYTIDNSDGKTGLFQFDYGTGNYYYDSACNAAWYNPDTQKMELYDYALVPSGSLACIGGNFLPFNLGHEDGRLVPTQEGWKNDHTDYGINDRTYQLNGIHHDNDPVIGRSSMTDLWFGMTLEIEFTMTADGTLVPIDPSGKALDMPAKDMLFEFTGDDDVLVYVDDVLCLDIGGIHGAEYGDINFRTGVIHKGGKGEDKRQSNLLERFTAAGKESEIQNGTLKPWTKHTLKFFYLERGGNISNCRIGYNLANIPVGGMSVTKEVEGIGADQDYYGEYQFQLKLVESGATEASDLYYIIRDQKGQIVKEETKFTKDELEAGNVTFTLKANQTAEFFGFPAGTQLQVVEIGKTKGEDISKVKMVKAGGTGEEEFQEGKDNWRSEVITISDDNLQECKVTCVNQLDEVEVDISKALAMLDYTQVEGMEETQFQLTYTITKPGETTGEEQTLTLKPNEHPKLTVPFGSWLEIQEAEINGYKVEWDYKVKKAEENGGAIVDKSHVTDGDFHDLPGIHLVGDTEIICRNLMTFVEVKKTVEGNVKEGEMYHFDYTVEYDGTTVKEGKIDLPHDGTYRILNLPIGSKVTVTEEEGDYLTSYVITEWKPTTEGEPPAQGESQKKKEGSTATCENVDTPQVIHFTNRPVYYLPATGGTGTQLYTMGGLLLMAAAILLYNQHRRRKGDHVSP